jgi:hypothetical protein
MEHPVFEALAIASQYPRLLGVTMPSPDVIGSDREGGDRQRNYWAGSVSSTWWFYFTGNSTDEVWKAYVEHCKAMLQSQTPNPSLVCIAHRADSPSPSQRRMIADFIDSESERLRSLVGFALVLDSPLHIFALRAINWLVKKPFPETVCGSPSTAATWLEDHGAAIDPESFRAELEARVPRQHLGVL